MKLPEENLVNEYLVDDLIEPGSPDDIALEKLYSLIDEENL